MREEESLINLKRQEWRVDIRKKQLENYFQKRRFQLLSEDYHRNSSTVSNEERCSHIANQIAHFSFAELRNSLAQVVAMDPTLSAFYHLTHFDPHSPPAYFRTLIAETLDAQLPIDPGPYLDREFSGEERGRLQEIWREAEELWVRVGPQFIGILAEMKRVDSEAVDLLIRQDFISFLSIVLNALLVFKNIAGVLGVSLQKQLVVGSESHFRYEINTTFTIMHNILSGSDQLLSPIIDDFLEINGCSFESEGLYYNFFIIKGVSPQTKIKMFHYYANILENYRSEILDSYDATINTLYAALKVLPEFTDTRHSHPFAAVCERIVRFLADLLTIINMRYETFSYGPESDDYQSFIAHLTWILYHLGNMPDLIGSIMQAKSIHTFLLNHLNPTSADGQLKVVSLALRLLCAAANNAYSIHFFLNEEPRFMIKVLLLFDRFLPLDFQNASVELENTLNSLLYLLSSLSTIAKVSEQFLERGLLHKIAIFYFRVSHKSSHARQIRESCQILYLNLLGFLKKNCMGLRVFYEHLFDKNHAYVMLIQMLKLSPRKQQTVRNALVFLSFIAYNCRQTSHLPLVRETLLSETLAGRLFELRDCKCDHIREKVEYIQQTIEGLRRVRGGEESSASFSDEEELI